MDDPCNNGDTLATNPLDAATIAGVDSTAQTPEVPSALVQEGVDDAGLDDAAVSTPSAARPGVMLLLTRLAKVLHRKSTEELLGMRFRHFIALRYLADRDSCSQQMLGEDLMVDANNVVILLNELEAAGFAERRRDPLDRRRHTVVVTAAGRRAIERAEHAREALEDEVLAGLTPEERETLGDLLRRALEVH
jgi:DNA-binding MarR family transcriptional regulator